MTPQRRISIGLAVVSLLSMACSAPTAPTPPSPPPVSDSPPVQPPPPPPPALTIACPVSQTASSPSGAPVSVTFPAPVPSGGVAPLEVSCSRQSGSMFPVGSTSVQCRVVDAAEQSATCLFDVTITVPPIPQLTRTRFLAFGDSMTAGEVSTPIGSQGTGGPNFKLIVVPAASYPMQLADALKARYATQASSIVVQNFGLPGEWAQDGAYRLPGVLGTYRPEVVLLMEGYNDIGSQRPVETNAAVVALDAMAKEARNRGARVMLATLPPPRPGGTHSLPTKVVTDFNAWVRSIAQGEGAILVDVYAGLSTDVSRYIGVDGLHPTEAGYARMAELFRDAIRTNLEVR